MRFIFNIIFGLLAINSALAAFTNAQAAPPDGEQHTPKIYLNAGAGGGVVGGGKFSNVGVMGTRLSAGYWLTSDLAIEGAQPRLTLSAVSVRRVSALARTGWHTTTCP